MKQRVRRGCVQGTSTSLQGSFILIPATPASLALSTPSCTICSQKFTDPQAQLQMPNFGVYWTAVRYSTSFYNSRWIRMNREVYRGIQAHALLETELLHETLSKLHRQCEERSSKQRKNAVDAHNRRTGILPINFSQGDFVLRGFVRIRSNLNVRLKWYGPFRVTISRYSYIFKVKDLLSGKKECLHCLRLKFFSNKDLEVTEKVKQHVLYQSKELLTVEELMDVRKKQGVVELLVKWKIF